MNSLEEVGLDTHRITQNLGSGHNDPKQLQPGIVLEDRYAIQDVVGVGGMGSVYRARDLHFPNVIKLVAVKEMINTAPDPVVRQTIVQNFEREAHILVALSHPSIPKIYDFFTRDDRSYLVLEYVNGRDLEAILNSTQQNIPEDQVISWAIELCDVLDYLHNHKPEPIIFRDMKPSNIMINQDGRVILVDFGIAKVFRLGHKGTMIGTEGYSPPEQYRGEASPQGDIYALGATLHHVLTRRDPRLEPPFTFSERQIRQINPNVSIEFETVVNTALQYTPAERFQSATAMKDAMLVVARETGALNRISVQAAINVKEANIKPLWTFKCEDEIRGTPTIENGVVYVGAYDNNLYAVHASNGQFMWKFPAHGGIVGKPLVFDNLVYFGSSDHNLYSVSTRTGKLNWTFTTNGAVRTSPRLAEGHVFIGSDDCYLHAVNILSGNRTWRVEASGAIRSTPFITNEYIYFGCEAGELFCVDFRGQVKWRFQAKRAITSSPLVDKGVVFITSLDATTYAIDAKAGWGIWRFRMGKGSVSSPVKSENYVIFGSADDYIYCLDASNAREIWRFHTDHQVSGSPVVYKDSVYVGAADGSFYSLEIRTGRLRWRFNTGGPITGSAFINNDVVFLGSCDHILYALLA
jgi:eukaryotic-like serine/threonine-protein kinase